MGTIAVAYIPVAFVVFAEHLADHKNLSTIIERDLLENPGLSRTLMGDGVGSIVGAIFGGCPNTTYGESMCIITKTPRFTHYNGAVLAIVISFLSLFVAFVNTILLCDGRRVALTASSRLPALDVQMVNLTRTATCLWSA